MEGRRGTRSRVTDHSVGTGLTPPLNTTVEGARSVKTQPSVGSDEHSQVEHASSGGKNDQSANPGAQNGDTAGAQNQNGAPEGTDPNQQGGDGQDETQDSTHQTNSYGHSPEEAAEFEKLKQGKTHADRKIHQQGEDNSALAQENQQLNARLTGYDEKFGRLEGVLAQVLARSGGAPATGGTARPGAGGEQDEFDDFGSDPQNNGDRESQHSTEEFDQLKGVVGSVLNSTTKLTQRLDAGESERQREGQIAVLEREFGATREAAEVMLEANSEGDIVRLLKTALLTTVPKEARDMAKERRDLQRQSTFHPATGGAPFASAMSDETAIRSQAEKIMGMPDGRPKQYAVEKFISDHPGDGAMAIAELSGFNV